MDRIDCLSAFVRVMESGSFSSAAHELGVGQPAISKRIALLEQEFATQLFLRSTRKLKPTAEAHRVYDLARQLLNSFEQARSSVIDASPRPSGTLRLSVPSSSAAATSCRSSPTICATTRICASTSVSANG
jgi:DNA-binding transcriptional LysR family regulator